MSEDTHTPAPGETGGAPSDPPGQVGGAAASPAAPSAEPEGGTTAPPASPAAPAEEEKSKGALALGQLPEEIKNALILRRQQNIVTAQIAGTNWGKGLDVGTQRAIADWAREYRIDAGTEIDVLGGRVYLNARFYLNRLAELIAHGMVQYAVADHIENSEQLEVLAADDDPETAARAKKEITRRAFERATFNAPPNAASTVVFRVKLIQVPSEFAACKWTGNGTRKNDPVGNEFPVETSESRAARRCLRLLISPLPTVGRYIESMEEAAETRLGEIMARPDDDPPGSIQSGVMGGQRALNAPVITPETRPRQVPEKERVEIHEEAKAPSNTGAAPAE